MRLPPGPEGPRRALRFGIDQRDVKVAKLRRGLPLRAARLGLIGQGAPDPDRDVGRRPGASRWRSGRTTRPNGSSGSPTSAPARTRRSRLTHRKARSCHSREIYPRGGSSNRRRARASFHPQQAKMGQTRSPRGRNVRTRLRPSLRWHREGRRGGEPYFAFAIERRLWARKARLVLSFSRLIRQDRAPPVGQRHRPAVGGDGS
jgi:hypothetical protein